MLNKKNLANVFFFAFLAAGSLSAMADLGLPSLTPFGSKPDLSSLDTDGDGTVSDAEWTAARTAEFKKIDTDSDGYATDAEVTAYAAQKAADAFAALDTDGSSALTEAEFVGDKTGRRAKIAKKAFNLADADDNASLTLDEYKSLLPPATMEMLRFSAMDTDDDGKVSEAEFLAAPKGRGHRGGHGGHGGHRGRGPF